MHRRTIRSFATLATVALAVSGAGSMASAASAAVSHHPPSPTAGRTVTATNLSTGRSAAKVKGWAPGQGQAMNEVCQQYAGLIDQAIDGQNNDINHGDDAGAAEWRDLATQVVNGGKAAGCQFAFQA